MAAALGVSTRAGMVLLADSWDLAHRLPLAQELVDSLRVAPWRARRLAHATRGLSQEAAAYVDTQVAPVLDSCGPTRIERLVEEARARFDPVEQADVEDEQRAGWGVRLVHGPSGRYAGTSWLEITGDTPTGPGSTTRSTQSPTTSSTPRTLLMTWTSARSRRSG